MNHLALRMKFSPVGSAGLHMFLGCTTLEKSSIVLSFRKNILKLHKAPYNQVHRADLHATLARAVLKHNKNLVHLNKKQPAIPRQVVKSSFISRTAAVREAMY